MHTSFLLYWELIRISLPVVIASISINTTYLVVTVITGKYSVNAMAATAIYFSINALIYNVFLASFTGYRILGSKALGNDNLHEANLLFNSNIIFTFLLSVLIIVFISIFDEFIISFFSRSVEIVNLTKSLLKVVIWCYPLNSIILTLSINLALQKKTYLNMYISIFCNMVGASCTYFLVYGIESLSGLGVIGVAWANLLQTILTLFLYSIIFPRAGSQFIFNTKLSLRHTIRIWKLSYPCMISMVLDYLSNILIFTMIGYFLGPESLASGRLGFTFFLLIFSTIVAISTGFNILGGRALGNNNAAQFISYYRCNKYITVTCAIFISLIFLLCPHRVLGFFTRFDDIQALSYTPLIILAFISPLAAWSYNNALYLRLIEKVKLEMLCNVLPLWLIQIPAAYYFGIVLNWQLKGFFIAFLLYEVIYFISTSFFVYQNQNILRKQHYEEILKI